MVFGLLGRSVDRCLSAFSFEGQAEFSAAGRAAFQTTDANDVAARDCGFERGSLDRGSK